MFIISFINAALVIQLVYFRWFPYDVDFVLFEKQEYSYFDMGWYREVGATITMTVLFLCFTPHASNLAYQAMQSSKRCCDRSCRLSSKRTKQIIQQDYEQINMGDEFMFEFRYCNILTVLSTAFFYSSGIPVLYFFAAIFFFVTYWIDKILILRFYKKPAQYDDYLAIHILKWYKVVIILHVIGLLLMFGITHIFQEDIFQTIDESMSL